MPTTTHVVTGMTGQHCADFVTAELRALPGVSHVHVDPVAGTASVTSAGTLDFALVRAAVTRAGFVMGEGVGDGVGAVGGEPERSRAGWGPFVRHYVEMVVAMVVGMMVLGPLVGLALPDSEVFHRADVGALVMATNMTIGMSAWMVYRKHGWASIAEMAAAMYLPFVALLIPYWAGVLSGGAVMTLGHVLMLPLMALAMLRRRDEYSGHHGRHGHAH
jgi:copper chaperone CopZ